MTDHQDPEHLDCFKVALDHDHMEILRAEYEHVSAAFLSNEESGERHVNVLFGVIAAVTAGLAIAMDSDPDLDALLIISIAAAVLFLFGLMTWLRIIKRNVATDEYLNAMRRIRACWAWQDPQIVPMMAFVPGDKPKTRTMLEMLNPANAGHLQVVVATNCILVFAGIACLAQSEHWLGKDIWGALRLGGLGFLCAWIVLILSACVLYGVMRSKRTKDRKKDLASWCSRQAVARKTQGGQADPAPAVKDSK